MRSLIYSLLIDSGKACEMGKETLTFNLMPFGRVSFITCISVAFGRRELFVFVLDPPFGLCITIQVPPLFFSSISCDCFILQNVLAL